MPKRCALGCSNKNSYHRFPHPEKNPDGFKAWVHIAGGKLDSPADYELYRKKVICDIHFTDRDRNRNNRLNFLAVPSLHLPGIKAVSQPHMLATHPIANTDVDESRNDENSKGDVPISAISDATKTDSGNEKNTLSNLAASRKSATREVQPGDQHESDDPALSDDMLPNAGSRGDLNIPESSPPPQLNLHTAQMCRVCLALDVRMFDLRDTELRTMFQSTTGITFEERKGSKLGSLICWQCTAGLKAASTFRNKALFSDSLLQGLINKGEQIQIKNFETVKEEADGLISPKTLTVTDVYHIVEIDDQNNMTQLVQSGDGDELSQSESIETEESMLDEIKEQIKDKHSVMDVEEDNNFVINTEIEDDPTCHYTEEESITYLIEETLLDGTSSIEDTIYSGYSPLLHIGHTSLRSDLTSSQEDCDDQISKTPIETITKSKTVPKQNIEHKYPIKRSKVAVSHDHEYYFKADTEEGNKKKKFKKK